jgi:ABC-type multidrug transport system fused ATPase/permease subunit
MLVIVLVSGLATAVRGATFNTISEKIANQLRYDLLYFIINKDVGFFDTQKTGDILSRLSGDTEVV